MCNLKNILIKDLDKNVVEYEYFVNKIKEVYDKEYSFYIGSDSQMFYDKTSVVTAICFYHKGKGCNGFYIKEKIDTKKFNSLRDRMHFEAFRSIEVAFELQRIIDADITIHLDIGSDPIKNKTSRFKKELTNMVLAQGFDVEVKPKSWASWVADWFTKT